MPIRISTTKGEIALVHNGIIENYSTLKQFLTAKGHTFKSQTDTEVLAMLIGDLYSDLIAQDLVAPRCVGAAAGRAGGPA